MNSLVEIVKEHGPIKRDQLAKKMRRNWREVSQEIHDLNCAGVPIVFTGKGFVYARKRGDVMSWARNQKAAAFSILRKVAAVTKTDVEGVTKELFT